MYNTIDTIKNISHIRETDMAIQLNEEHQKSVGSLAKKFASEFGMGELGQIMGLLHDKGKEQIEWQKYIQGVTGYNKKFSQIKSGPHHAYIGAIIAQKVYPEIAPLIAQPIAGHHRGLYDYCDYIEETRKEIPNEIIIDRKTAYSLPKKKLKKQDYHHLVRMLFSCLVDADSLDTERFINPEQSKLRGSQAKMEELLKKLEEYLHNLKTSADNTKVNSIRNFVQEMCVKESCNEQGFYSLSVPTGGGKTLASVLWGLHHALKHHLQRIIIAIPYTSIIVQTAGTLKRIFGEENVLEHHSNINTEEIKDLYLRERLNMATENWDYPIIVTTNVQLFESLFNNKRYKCRKLHNIVKSVLILDEVQTLPINFYKPIVQTFDTLHRLFGVSFLFTTASLPALTGHIEGTIPSTGFEALKSIHEIIPKEIKLHDIMRRVDLNFIETPYSYDQIAAHIAKHQQVLCIVNSRRDAKEIYTRLPKEGLYLHLSRMMCPAHIAATIQFIKNALKENLSQPIRVISTQLIEAGVDIDFPVVFRQEAGLDSILQAAGRCNREGKHRRCTTHVFSFGKNHPLPPGYFTKTNDARLNMGHNHDWFAPETMSEYFQHLFSRTGSFDEVFKNGIKYSIEGLLYKKDCEFEKASEIFQMIDDQTISIIINWDNSLDLFKEIISQGPSYSLMKRIAQYSVNIRHRDFQKLKMMGAIDEPYNGIYAVMNPSFYNSKTGLVIDNQWTEETYII